MTYDVNISNIYFRDGTDECVMEDNSKIKYGYFGI
jgi:hypothetical protein